MKIIEKKTLRRSTAALLGNITDKGNVTTKIKVNCPNKKVFRVKCSKQLYVDFLKATQEDKEKTGIRRSAV